MTRLMDKDRLILGIGRLENALSRLERAIGSNVPGRPDEGLLRRHHQLRAEVEAAVSRIDALITQGDR